MISVVSSRIITYTRKVSTGKSNNWNDFYIYLLDFLVYRHEHSASIHFWNDILLEFDTNHDCTFNSSAKTK